MYKCYGEGVRMKLQSGEGGVNHVAASRCISENKAKLLQQTDLKILQLKQNHPLFYSHITLQGSSFVRHLYSTRTLKDLFLRSCVFLLPQGIVLWVVGLHCVICFLMERETVWRRYSCYLKTLARKCIPLLPNLSGGHTYLQGRQEMSIQQAT